jgi:hypothetical protein
MVEKKPSSMLLDSRVSGAEIAEDQTVYPESVLLSGNGMSFNKTLPFMKLSSEYGFDSVVS